MVCFKVLYQLGNARKPLQKKCWRYKSLYEPESLSAG